MTGDDEAGASRLPPIRPTKSSAGGAGDEHSLSDTDALLPLRELAARFPPPAIDNQLYRGKVEGITCAAT